MSNNQIFNSESFYDCMTKFTILETLDLSYNNLGAESHLKLDTFTELSNVEVLSLAGNKISVIPYGLFSFQKNLHTLDLSHNDFKIFEPKFFVSLTNLRSLDMSFNKLRSVYEFIRIRKFIPTLSDLGIEGNDFSCDCLSHLLVKFNLEEREKRYIQITSPKKAIKKHSNIAGLICTDEIRPDGQDIYCRED